MKTTSLILLVFLTFWDSITLSQAQCNPQDLTCSNCTLWKSNNFVTNVGATTYCYPFELNDFRESSGANDCCCQSEADCIIDRTFKDGSTIRVTGNLACLSKEVNGPKGCRGCESDGDCLSGFCDLVTGDVVGFCAPAPAPPTTNPPTINPTKAPTSPPSLSPTDTPTKAPTLKPTMNPTINPSASVLPTTTTKKPTISPSNFPSLAPTPLDPSVDSTSNSTGTLDTGNSTNTTAAISPLARYLRELQVFSCASDEVIDALDETTFTIVASALENDTSQEVTSVKTKECTKDGSVITYVQEVKINVLCGSDGCEATAEELEDNPPAAAIADVINEAIKDGSFVATLQTKAGDELEGTTANEVIVVAGPLVLNTLSPSVSPTSSSPTVNPTSSSPTTKSPVMIDSPTDNSAAPTSSTSMKNKGNKSGKKGGTKAVKSSLDSKAGSSKADNKSKESSKSSKSTKIEEKDEPETEESIKVNEENELGESIKVEDIEDEDTKEEDTKNNSILDSLIGAILGFLN